MSRVTGMTAPFLALAMICGVAAAQPPRVQDMAFGGGSHFEFLIPVSAQGRIFAQATWSANVSITAELYSPERVHPVQVTRGSGLVQISHPVASWRAGDQWLLKLTADQNPPDLKGNLHVVWPAGKWPLNVVRWQNAGPTDPATRLALQEGLRQVNTALAARGNPTSVVPVDPPTRTELRRMTTTLATRMEVLAEVPDRYIVNDVTPAASTIQVARGSGTGTRGLGANLVQLVCLDHKPWHTDRESDQPFVVAAFLPADGKTPRVARTKAFEAVYSGDAPIASASGQPLLQADGRNVTHLAVALFDSEGDVPDDAMARFQRGVELYQLFSRLNGGDDPAVFAWVVAITGEGLDDVVGTPRLLAIVPSADSLSPTSTLAFTGHGARYEVAVQVGSR